MSPMREHVYFKCDPCKSNGHCMFCDGGLLYCTVCKCGEVELAAECPGPISAGAVPYLIADSVPEYERSIEDEPTNEVV